MSVQYRITSGKAVEAVGPEDAEVVVTIAAADCALDPTVAFMLGKLKATGPTGPLFDELRSGRAASVLGRFAPA